MDSALPKTRSPIKSPRTSAEAGRKAKQPSAAQKSIIDSTQQTATKPFRQKMLVWGWILGISIIAFFTLIWPGIPRYAGSYEVEISTNPVDKALIVFVPAGEFDMGSESGESKESLVQTVYLDAFWIYQTEVTIALYQQCVKAGVCERLPYKRRHKDHPVAWVDSQQSQVYCEWAGGSLPTEAQWEKAARGTDGRTYPWGEGINHDLANYSDKNSYDGTLPVGSYPGGSSPYGALDMAGNVSEWVTDWNGGDYQNSPMENPTGPESGRARVLRGGSWFNNAYYLRAAYRKHYFPDSTNGSYGFRCAFSLDSDS